MALVLIPALAVVLPWPWFFRLARLFSRAEGLFKAETDLAVAAVSVNTDFTVDTVWRRHYRLYKIIDASDPWLARFRGTGWLSRYVDIEGSWPQKTPFIASSLHFGAGLWALRHIREQAAAISMVLRPQAEWQASFSQPMQVYLRAYERAIVAAGGGEITHTGPGLRTRFKQGLENNINQLVLIDVPGKKNIQAVNFLDKPAYFADGLIGLSQQLQKQIVPYVMMLDFQSGRRRLLIGPVLDPGLSLEEAMQALSDFFDPLVRRQSEGWQLWGQYPAFLHKENNPEQSA